MQIKLFTIPIMGGEKLEAEMNTFLRSKKILKMESHLVQEENGTSWCFLIRYLAAGQEKASKKVKIDYKENLDAASFERFRAYREIRKHVAQQEAIPAYAVFTDKELAAIAQIEKISLAAMRKIKGIGQKKVEKYGNHFILDTSNETS